MAPHTAYFRVKIRTHTRHISEFFGHWQNSRCLFTPDLWLFKSNTAREEGISANSQTQNWRTAIFWLAVTSSHALFVVGSKNQVNLLLFFKPGSECVSKYENKNQNASTIYIQRIYIQRISIQRIYCTFNVFTSNTFYILRRTWRYICLIIINALWTYRQFSGICKGSGPLCVFQCNFVVATARNPFLDARLVPDEVTPYRRQYYLLRDA